MTPFEQDYLNKFQNLELRGEDFDHRGHLYMAWLHLKHFEWTDANTRVCEGIHDLANKLGAPEKYNRTLTQALMVLMASRLNKDSQQDFVTYIKENPDLVKDAKGLLLSYYSETRLFSDHARQHWMEPDLKEFPAR